MKEPLTSRLLFPVVEREFTYRSYDEWLGTLSGVPSVTLRELAASGEPAFALRHDVDSRLESAVETARLEHERGLRATYFVLHTASYYRSGDGDLLATLLRIQEDFGHEIGWHNDLLTLQRVFGVDVESYLARELEWLRAGGLQITGTAAHGSPWCHRLGFHNNYIFRGWDEQVPGFPSTSVDVKLDPEAFGLEYEAYHLAYDTYYSDSSFIAGRRWHPSGAKLGERTVVLIHPCHWDTSVAAKAARLGRKLVARATRRPTRA